MKSLPRGLRNNNPGNIRTTKDKWQGLREKQTDKDFFQFTEMKWGYRALIRTLLINTLSVLIVSTGTYLMLRHDPNSNSNAIPTTIHI